MGLAHGGTWSKDLTWLEPVTSCVNTNLTIEIEIKDTPDSFLSNSTVYFVDRGAFRDLDHTALETGPWVDNQTLNLFGRARKAARMCNVLTASFLNVSLPLDPSVETVPKIDVDNSTLDFNSLLFSAVHSDAIMIDRICQKRLESDISR